MQSKPGGEGEAAASSSEEMTYQSAIRNTGLAVAAAAAFAVGIAGFMGLPKAMEFMTGYVVEESLSVDNLFVFILLFDVSVRPRRPIANAMGDPRSEVGDGGRVRVER